MKKRDSISIPSKSPCLRRISFCLLFVSFLICAFFLPMLNQTDFMIPILFLSIQSNSLCGILTQIETVILICYVAFYQKRGLKMAFFLSGINLATSLVPIIKLHRLNSVAGIIMNSIALVVDVIIYRYGKKLNAQTRQLAAYNRDLNKKQITLHKLAYYDYLTNLPNRRQVVEVLTSLCAKSLQNEFHFVVIDLKNFKKFNDIAGHQKGDDFLKELVANWSTLLHKDDILGRIDGDEFALIIPRHLSIPALNDYILGFRSCVTNRMPFIGSLPLQSTEQSLILNANFGIVSYPEHGQNAEELMRFADTALAVSKEDGPNMIRYFNKPMYEAMIEKATIESALICSLNNIECYLRFQPQFETETKKLRGFETLVRWKNEELGEIPPSIFIPLAEETGYILALGEWILRNALESFTCLFKHYPSDIIVSVNISVMQFLHPHFMDMLVHVLKETGFNPEQLELEITESVFISSKEEVVTILNEIKSLGIKIALDDFGTRYSSLSYIKDLPLDVIKIDKSFVDAILEDRKKAQLVDTILVIAKQLDYKVVAEGVENVNQLIYLNERSCDYIQGYLWGKPLSMDEAAVILSEYSTLIS